MRNLKKILALVLALVMSMSMLATANAFQDSEDISGDFEEAVDVLAALGVFQGYNDGETFQPQGKITRAEVAAIIYRIVTGDVADDQVKIYKDYNKFDDVKSASWYAGYVNFCANAEIIKGRTAKTFAPNDTVTGYEALAMILRAIGYDKNHEFEGTGWAVQTAAVAKKLGITDKIVAGTLGTAATREVVAEILFQTILVPQVTYTLALGYLPIVDKDSLGYETFKLVGKVDANDVWGRPSEVWMLDAAPLNHKADPTDAPLVSRALDPVVEYWTAPTECTVAQDFPFTGTKDFVTYTNGIKNAGTDKLYANDTINTIGDQGRHTLVYKDRIVYIDTLLAEVVAVRKATFDVAGHLKTPSTITLKIFDANNASTTVTLTNSAKDYPYAAGEMVLVNAVQNGTKVATVASQLHVDILGVAETLIGAQSTIWANIKKHVIAGETYDDNVRFHLDQAGTDVTNHTWYFDKQGNLIGATDIVSTNYAVLKNIRWVVGAPGHAEATLVDMNGEDSVVTVASLDAYNGTWCIDDAKTSYQAHAAGSIDGNTAFVSDDTIWNKAYEGYALYRVDTNLNGTVNLEGYEGANTIVNYVPSAKFTTNASAILSATGSIVTFVSSNTQYLIKGANNTYVPVTGTEAMASYSDVELFYVDVNGDQIAEYVYIRSGVLAGANEALVFVTTSAYTNGLTSGAKTSTMVANVNGEADVVLTTTAADTALLAGMAANVNKLYIATLDPATGYVTAVKAVSDGWETLANGYTYVRYIAVPTALNGATLVSNRGSFRVDGAKVIGLTSTLEEAIAGGYGVWVVYTEGVVNTASVVYVGAVVPNTESENQARLAAATAILNGASFDAISLVDGDNTKLEAAVKAAILNKLVAAGVNTTGMTITFNVNPSVPATSGGLAWFQYTLTVGTGATAASTVFNGNNVVVNNTITTATIAEAIKAKLEETKRITEGMTKPEYTKIIEIKVAEANADFEITRVDLVGDLIAGKQVQVTVTGVDEVYGAITVVASITVQAK